MIHLLKINTMKTEVIWIVNRNIWKQVQQILDILCI